jgi:hypothetical protein
LPKDLKEKCMGCFVTTGCQHEGNGYA